MGAAVEKSWGRIWQLMLPLYLAALLFLSLNPWLRPATSSGSVSPDKLAHALAYAGLVVLTYLFLGSASKRWRHCSPCRWMAALAISMGTGIVIEIAQSLLTTSRTGSIADAGANAVGVVLGYALFQAVRLGLRKA